MATTYFKSTVGRQIFCVLCAVFMWAVLIIFGLSWQWWVSLLWFGLGLVALIGWVDAISSYLHLREETLEYRQNFRLKVIDKALIKRVSSEGGVLSVLLKGDNWVHLPSLGHNPQGLSNSVRAWLKRNHRETPQSE